jgi:hypothetical protein
MEVYCVLMLPIFRRPLLVSFLILHISGSCSRVPGPLPSCCAAGLIEPDKLLSANSAAAPAKLFTATVEYSLNKQVNLNQFLRQSPSEGLEWSVNGSELRDAILLFDSAPKEDSVLIYSVLVRRRGEQRSDAFELICLPVSTRQKFEAWFNHESKDMGWLAKLPPAYSSLGPGLSDPEPKNCGKQYWEGVHKLDTNFHPGGAYEMRSKAFGDDNGHQAVYDSQGKLIRDGLGAGSADRGSPHLWNFGLIKHRDRDVRTFVWAAQLDGNPVNPTRWFRNLDAPLIRLGEHIKNYQFVRPALTNEPAEVAAGTCLMKIMETR